MGITHNESLNAYFHDMSNGSVVLKEILKELPLGEDPHPHIPKPEECGRTYCTKTDMIQTHPSESNADAFWSSSEHADVRGTDCKYTHWFRVVPRLQGYPDRDLIRNVFLFYPSNCHTGHKKCKIPTSDTITDSLSLYRLWHKVHPALSSD